MPIRLFQVDSFTYKELRGNPAGVCLLDREHKDEWLANIARELDCSATAFLLPRGKDYSIRWFTPKQEVPLCGHASLASAHVLYELGHSRADKLVFHYSGGKKLNIQSLLKEQQNWIEIEFRKPSYKARPLENARLAFPQSMGLEKEHEGQSYYSKDLHYFLLEINGHEKLKALKPDFELLRQAGNYGYIVTSRAEELGVDFVSRFFAPAHGINEDPVCGSAHTFLANYWSSRLSKSQLSAIQLSKRGGALWMKVEDRSVHLQGQAITRSETSRK